MINNYVIFYDKNKSMFKKDIIQGYQLLMEERLIRLFSVYGAVDLAYDSDDAINEDYKYIKEVVINERQEEQK